MWGRQKWGVQKKKRHKVEGTMCDEECGVLPFFFLCLLLRDGTCGYKSACVCMFVWTVVPHWWSLHPLHVNLTPQLLVLCVAAFLLIGQLSVSHPLTAVVDTGFISILSFWRNLHVLGSRLVYLPPLHVAACESIKMLVETAGEGEWWGV